MNLNEILSKIDQYIESLDDVDKNEFYGTEKDINGPVAEDIKELLTKEFETKERIDVESIKRRPAPSPQQLIPIKVDNAELPLNHWLEDFDNVELSDYDRKEQLRNAVIAYNQAHGTSNDPDKGVKDYLWERYKEGSESAE